jgi:VWFA-related protein
MRILAATYLLLAAGACAFAQSPAPIDVQESIKVDVDVVNVLCTIRDRKGVLVKDLDQQNFEIREDGKPQQVRYFARETDLPLTIGLLVDVSGSVRRLVQAEKNTAERFLEQVLRPQDQALLVGFSSTVVLWRDFTDSPSLLLATLEKLHAVPFRGVPKDGGPAPCTLLYDAVHSTANDKFQGVPGRKAMLVISDGTDIGSRQTIEGAIRAVQSANTIVYGICYRNPRDSGCSYLQTLAEPTGGRMFPVTPETPLSAIFQTIQEELRSQYSLGYVSTNTARDGSFRKLQVEVQPKGFKVEARKGYYAREQAAAH